MARFTLDDMRDELRTIFLFEADHIAMGASEALAEHFIGTRLRAEDREDEFLHLSPSRVDLGRFAISHTFDQAYGFAFAPGLSNELASDQVQDLNVFMEGTPRVGGRSMSAGEMHRFMTPDGFCKTVQEMAFARWKLEIEEIGPFSTRELALLANMSEGAVRNAMADKDEGRLKVISGSKPVEVEHDEAKRWLIGRRGFVPTPSRLRDDPNLREKLSSIQTAVELGDMIRRHRLVFKSLMSPSLLEWPVDELSAWENGSFVFDAVRAQDLASGLDLDVPVFAGKALEVALRRDAKAKARS